MKKNIPDNGSDVLNSLDNISAAELPPFFNTRLQAKLDKRLEQETGWLYQRGMRWMLPSLAILFIVNLSAGLYYLNNTSTQQNSALHNAVYQSLETDADHFSY